MSSGGFLVYGKALGEMGLAGHAGNGMRVRLGLLYLQLTVGNAETCDSPSPARRLRFVSLHTH
jgi:hypothetical protein